ncbi:MAG: cytochrome b/b6 domain-containing protein [Bdellovibrionota bacterium]
METTQIIEKHSRAVRWCHWINFPLVTLMVWSGILIYWANQAYIKIPKPIAKDLKIEFHLADGISWHLFLIWPFIINGLVYVLYLAFSGEWKYILPNRQTLPQALQVVKHDLKISKTLPVIDGKLNGAQRIAYTLAILLGAGMVITGLAIFKPIQLSFLTQLLGGYEAARLEHFVLTCLFLLFFIIHIAQVIRAGWNNFRAMVAGYEVVNENSKDHTS